MKKLSNKKINKTFRDNLITYGMVIAAYVIMQILVSAGSVSSLIKFFEQTGSNNYVFGLEESYGCLAGTHARDKDAVVAVMCLCEVAAYCKKHNMTLWDMMVSMYEKYGYFKETQYTITMKGIDGARQIAEIMDKLRKNPKSNVLYFELPDNAWCCARPSGTEPKIKFYMGVKGNSIEDAQAKVEKLTEDVKAVL